MITIDNDTPQEAIDEIIAAIADLEYSKIIQESDLESFHAFRNNALQEHELYFFALTTVDQAICWFLMSEDEVEFVMIPQSEGDNIKPIDYQEIPVWYLNHSSTLN